MRIAIYTAFVLALFLNTASAQKTLFTYGGTPVSKEEFLKAYEKNNADKKANFSEKSVREYLDLYALYKMKVREANEEKMDTVPAISNEIQGYKMQLARTYLSDKEVSKRLAREAYDRMKENVHVAHILVASRSMNDTVAVYEKIDSIYRLIRDNKADFNTLALKYSDDKGSAPKGGDIGYISALQVVYPFENAAYTTPVGQVSAPFRTQFGYHILKVLDKQPSEGMVEVQQIMILAPQSKGAEGLAEAKAKADTVEQELKNGTSFESLVLKYSDDQYSKNNQGKLEPFGAGKMTPEFEKAAFALKNPGDISAPVHTEFGYHIIKLTRKIPLQSYDAMENGLLRKIENDSRSVAAKEAYQQKVEKELHYIAYPDNFEELLKAVPDDSLNSKIFSAAPYTGMNKSLFELEGKKYLQSDFAGYVANITQGRIAGKKEKAFTDLLKMYKTTTIDNIQMANLEKTNATYRDLFNEYRDGTLLFALMDKKIWTRASKDTAGLREFFVENKGKYNWKPGFEGSVYQCGDAEYLKQFREDVNSGTDVPGALGKFNTPERPETILETHNGRFEFSSFPQLQPEDFTEGKATRIVNDGKPGTDFVIYARKVFSDSEPKTLEEAQGAVISDYQDYLEKQWSADLMKKYSLQIDEKTLQSIIKK